MLTPLTLRCDPRPLLAGLDRLARDQAPYATYKATDDAVKAAQTAVRASLRRKFVVRRAAYLDRLIKIEVFPTKASPRARIAVSGPDADLLARFEAGGTKGPREGRTVAVPRTGSGLARTSITQVIPATRRPRALLGPEGARAAYVQAARARRTRGRPAGRADAQLKASRAFVIRRADGSGLILERTGRRKSGKRRPGTGRAAGSRDPNVRVLYALQRSVRLPARLGFRTTVVDTVRRTYPERFVVQLRDAINNPKKPRT